MKRLGALLLVWCLVGGCVSQPQADDAQVAEFRRLARDAPATDEELSAAREYLGGLPRERQAAVARALAADEDPRVRAAGIDTLIRLGLERDAAPVLAERVAAGDDLTGMGYQLVHGDDPSRAVRVYVAVGRHLLERMDSFTGVERTRVEQFLSDGGAGDPLPAFSREAARERLDRIEAQLAKQG